MLPGSGTSLARRCARSRSPSPRRAISGAAMGRLDRERAEVRADVEALRADPDAPVRTAPARLVAGFAARRRADSGPIALVPCDNLPDNGAVAARVVGDLAELVDPALAAWMAESVATVTTMVDRITPETTAEDLRTVAEAIGARGPRAGGHRAVQRVGAQRKVPGWAAGLARRRRDPDRGRGAVRAAQAVAAQRRPLAAGLRRGRSGDTRRWPSATADDACRAWLDEWWSEAVRDTCASRPPTSPRTAARSWSGSPIRASVIGSIRSPPTARTSCRSACCPCCGANAPRAACRPARPGRSPAGCAISEGWARRSTMRAPTRCSRSPPARYPDAVRGALEFLDPALASDDALVTVVLSQAEELERTGAA